MTDKSQDTPSIKSAVKRLSGFLTRSASSATNPLKRPRSKTLNSVCSLPNKDAVPPRSALKGGRCPATSRNRSVSFHDSLPRLNFGPPLNFQLPSGTEWAEHKGGLPLPAVTVDDRSTDDEFRAIEYNTTQSATSLALSQPMARHDSSAEPGPLHRSRAVRHSRTVAGGPSGYAERRRTCLDFTRAMMQEKERSQSRTRSVSLLADIPAAEQSSRPVTQLAPNVPESQEVYSECPSPRTQEQIPEADYGDHISQAFREHVDRSLLSMEGSNQRRSAFLLESLSQMREALIQAGAELTNAEPLSTGDDEEDRARARAHALQRLSQTEDGDTSNDKADDAFSLDTPHDSAQELVEAAKPPTAMRREASIVVRDFAYAGWPYEDVQFDPALMPLPLRIPPRHPGRVSTVPMSERPSATTARLMEIEDVAPDDLVGMGW